MKDNGAILDPWMFIEPVALDVLMTNAEARIEAGVFEEDSKALAGKAGTRSEDSPLVTMQGDGVAVLDISSVLVRNDGGFLAWLMGGTSYDQIAKDFVAAMANPAVRSVVLNIDSPGGVVRGCNELANMIHRRRGDKRIVAYVDGMAASAAYWLASAADEIVADANALVGSIGTVLSAYPKSKYLIEVVSKNAPKKRLDPQTDAGRAEYQRIVDDLEANFIAGVARNRGVSEETVAAEYGRGGMFVGQRAVSAGLVDRLGSMDDLVAELSNGSGESININQATTEETMDKKILMAEHPELFAEILQEGKETGMESGKAIGSNEGVKAERARVLELLDAGADADETRKAIENGTPAAEAYKGFYAAEKAKRAKGLEELEASAAESAGTSTEEAKTDDDGDLPADQRAAKRARALADKDGIGYAAALARVLADDPKLVKAYEETFAVA